MGADQGLACVGQMAHNKICLSFTHKIVQEATGACTTVVSIKEWMSEHLAKTLHLVFGTEHFIKDLFSLLHHICKEICTTHSAGYTD